MNKFKEISRIFFISIIALVPFVVYPYSITPTTLIKSYIFIFFSLISLIFFILSKPKEIIFPNILILLLFTVEFISNILHFNLNLYPRYSEHILVSITLFIFIVLAINLFEKLNYQKIIIYSSPLVVFPSIIEVFLSSDRPGGTLGQANFLGIYTVLIILLFIKNFERLTLLFNKYLISIYYLLLLILFIKSASIASTISFILGLYYLKNELIKIIRKKFLFFLVPILLIFLILFGGVYLTKIKDIYFQVFDSKNTQISDSFLVRNALWNKTIEILYKNPRILFFGSGANSFSDLFEKNRGNILEKYSEKYLLFDKPHNYYLEILVSYGVFYLIVFIFLFIYLIKYKYEHYLIAPILIFIFFNWLDLYLKIIIFLILACNLKKIKFKSKYNKYILTIFLLFLLTASSIFNILIYRDTKYFFGDNKYFLIYRFDDIKELKIKDPLVLITFLNLNINSLSFEEKGKIFDYLIKNFPNNSAILFHLNKLL